MGEKLSKTSFAHAHNNNVFIVVCSVLQHIDCHYLRALLNIFNNISTHVGAIVTVFGTNVETIDIPIEIPHHMTRCTALHFLYGPQT